MTNLSLTGVPCLFSEDWHDYNPKGSHNSRVTARGIIRIGRSLLLGHFEKDDFYVFPGGGVEGDEGFVDALIREVKEETGYDVIRSSVSTYGYTKMVKADYASPDIIFTGLSYYFFAQVDESRRAKPDLTDSEKSRKMETVLVPLTDLRKVIKTNDAAMKRMKHSGQETDANGFPIARRYDYIYRETKVLSMLVERLRA